MMGKKIWIKKNYNKNFNQQIILDFCMIKFGPCFQKSQSWSFFIGLLFFCPNVHNKEFCRWTFFHTDFIN